MLFEISFAELVLPARRAQRPARKAAPPLVTMFDSVDLNQIPRNAQAVAGYADGWWPTFHLLAKTWPHARLLSIATNPAHLAHALDIEHGDALPGDAPDWYRLGPREFLPVFYASLSTMPEVRATLTKAGIVRPAYKLLVADWTGVPHIPAGYDGCQWTDRALGRNLDQSLLLPNFFSPF